METLDGLGWAAGESVLLHGVRIGLRSSEPEGLDELVSLLPPGWKPSSSRKVDSLYSLVVGGPADRPGVKRLSLLYGNSRRLARARELDDGVFYEFSGDLEQAVAMLSRRRLFVHAGAVGWRGRAVVLPGRTFTGKSTLTAALVRAGAAYYSDEFAVLDRRGRVHPFARPLSPRPNGAFAKPERTPVDRFGGTVGTVPLPVGLVVVSEYREGIRWRPRRLTPGRAVLELAANTVTVRDQPQVALEVLKEAVTDAAVLEGRRGDADETAELILARLDAISARG
jgi:hypothetical protein